MNCSHPIRCVCIVRLQERVGAREREREIICLFCKRALHKRPVFCKRDLYLIIRLEAEDTRSVFVHISDDVSRGRLECSAVKWDYTCTVEDAPAPVCRVSEYINMMSDVYENKYIHMRGSRCAGPCIKCVEICRCGVGYRNIYRYIIEKYVDIHLRGCKCASPCV